MSEGTMKKRLAGGNMAGNHRPIDSEDFNMISYRATFVAIAALLFVSLLFAQARGQARVVEGPGLEVDDVTVRDLPSGMIRLSWTAKAPSCDYSISYSVYRDTKQDFVPS
jgi:hypothetical protein